MERGRDRAYRLIWDFEHLKSCDQEYDLEIYESQEFEWTTRLMETDSHNFSEPVIFYTDPDFCAYTDYPVNNVKWPIMSRRMYYTLLNVGNFPHQVIPIAIVNETEFVFEPEKLILSNGQPNPEVTHFDDFVAVQLLEHSNFFDFDRSSYSRNERHSDWIDDVDTYALNEPLEGFPPLFRLTADPVILFVSAKAREALREEGIRGTAYYPLDRLQSEVDVPVQLPTYS